jgi:hypothetical protein
MNKSLEIININWKIMGATLACLSDEEQGDFFMGFADEINKYPTQHQRDLQLSYASDKFSDKQKDVYLSLGYKDE